MRVHDLSRRKLSPEGLTAALDRHAVVTVRGADLSDSDLVALLAELGEAMFTSGEVAVKGQPSLNVVTNAGRDRPPRSRFHTDSSYYRRPPAYTALRPVAVPESGGATVFIDMRDAVRAVDAGALRGRRARHVVTGVEPEPGEETESWQPLLRRHPSGSEALYLSVPERVVEVEGCSEAEARELVDVLYATAIAQPQLRHEWAAGDLLIWDNRTTLHRGDHSAVVGERTLHRGMVRGELPVTA